MSQAKSSNHAPDKIIPGLTRSECLYRAKKIISTINASMFVGFEQSKPRSLVKILIRAEES